MRILYITRGKQGLTGLQKLYHSARDFLEFRDQDGFFESSLVCAGSVDFATLSSAESLLQGVGYDRIVVNWKQQGFQSDEDRADTLAMLLQNTNAPSALFIGAAQAQYLPPEALLDEVDVIFKREPYRDRSRYKISKENQIKIVPTMISCPFVHAPRENILAKLYDKMRPNILSCANDEEVYEVGFSGADAAEHSLRRDVWQRVIDEGFTRIGGLQPNPRTKEPIPEALQGPRLKGKRYRNSLCAAKINLALDGIGEYTFRHQELLYLGKFILSSPSIRDLELPMPLTEGEHYVAFDDLDDMVAKIRYYLTHEDERKRIAENGKRLFDAYYNPARHGREILDALQSVVDVCGAKENIEHAK